MSTITQYKVWLMEFEHTSCQNKLMFAFVICQCQDSTQVFTYARHMLYYWATSPGPLVSKREQYIPFYSPWMYIITLFTSAESYISKLQAVLPGQASPIIVPPFLFSAEFPCVYFMMPFKMESLETLGVTLDMQQVTFCSLPSPRNTICHI